MSARAEIQECIDSLLTAAPYSLSPEQHQRTLLALLKKEVAYACEQNLSFRNYVSHWPMDFRTAHRVADLPFLPVGVFKLNLPLALVDPCSVKHTLASSATTGQVPSRVVLDGPTTRRMTKGVVTIIRDFIGPARRPYLVIDTPAYVTAQAELGARAAAIQGLRSFATEVVCCLQPDQQGESSIDLEKLLDCAAKWKDTDVLVYGFTHVIWTQFVQPLRRQGITLDIPHVHVLHSGGWKRLQQQAVTKDDFMRGVASVFGCSANRIIDFYGMVENVGVIYPDCEHGNKHVPAFADVIIRDPLTLAPVEAGERGLTQVCSALPMSFPGFLLLTEDLADLVGEDGCPCGRRGIHFRFAGRAPKAEVRGCGNVESLRERRWSVA
jgi:Acyl-protein synthetase, LuxE